jgi:hypothetical protein
LYASLPSWVWLNDLDDHVWPKRFALLAGMIFVPVRMFALSVAALSTHRRLDPGELIQGFDRRRSG